MGLLKPLLVLPRWVQASICFAALVLAATVWLKLHDRALIKADREAAAAAATQTARAADADARTKVDTTRSEVEATNDDAQQAAAGSDDPLRSAFDSLRRAEKTSSGNSTR